MNQFKVSLDARQCAALFAAAAILSAAEWIEFKPLFLLLHARLCERKVTGGGEEMLRLRAYDKLQELVHHGMVEKRDRQYRGVEERLAAFAEHLEAQHCRNLLEAVKSV